MCLKVCLFVCLLLLFWRRKVKLVTDTVLCLITNRRLLWIETVHIICGAVIILHSRRTGKGEGREVGLGEKEAKFLSLNSTVSVSRAVSPPPSVAPTPPPHCSPPLHRERKKKERWEERNALVKMCALYYKVCHCFAEHEKVGHITLKHPSVKS